MTPQQIYAKAAELIREHGWAQLRFGVDGRNFCLVGALSWAYCGSITLPLPRKVLLPVQALVDEPLTTWNDTPGRTVDEVLAVLDEASQQ